MSIFEKYKDGGKTKPYRAKDREDLNYRTQMYNDSLNAYIRGEKLLEFGRKNPFMTAEEHNKFDSQLSEEYPISSIFRQTGAIDFRAINPLVPENQQWKHPLYAKPKQPIYHKIESMQKMPVRPTPLLPQYTQKEPELQSPKVEDSYNYTAKNILEILNQPKGQKYIQGRGWEQFKDGGFTKDKEIDPRKRTDYNYIPTNQLYQFNQGKSAIPSTQDHLKNQTSIQPISTSKVGESNTNLPIFDILEAPQKGIVKAITGEYQTPSQAMDIKNPVGALVADILLDPTNLVGVGLASKLGKRRVFSDKLYDDFWKNSKYDNMEPYIEKYSIWSGNPTYNKSFDWNDFNRTKQEFINKSYITKDVTKHSLTVNKPRSLTALVNDVNDNSGDDISSFEKFKNTLPDNLKNTSEKDYNLKGYWEALGKPKEFDYSQPKEDDGFYHAFSRNPKTGEILKSKTHPTFKHAIEEDKKAGYKAYESPEGKVYTFSSKDSIPKDFKPFSEEKKFSYTMPNGKKYTSEEALYKDYPAMKNKNIHDANVGFKDGGFSNDNEYSKVYTPLTGKTEYVKLPTSANIGGQDNTSTPKVNPQLINYNSNRMQPKSERVYEEPKRFPTEKEQAQMKTEFEQRERDAWYAKSSGRIEDAPVQPSDFLGLGLAKAVVSGLTKKVGKETAEYLTTQTPLKNTYKYNPFAFKPNPEAYYRGVGNEGIKDIFESGVIRSKKQNAYPEPYFSKGVISDKYAKGYFAELTNEPMKGVGSFSTGDLIQTPANTVGINNPNLKLYQKDWLRGYKEVPKPKQIDNMPKFGASFSKNTPMNKVAPQVSDFIPKPTMTNTPKSPIFRTMEDFRREFPVTGKNTPK